MTRSIENAGRDVCRSVVRDIVDHDDGAAALGVSSVWRATFVMINT